MKRTLLEELTVPSLHHAIDLLPQQAYENNFDPEEEFYEISFTENITGNDLRRLIYIPYENTIMRVENNFLLYTGGAGAACYGDDGGRYNRYQEASWLHIHTHTAKGTESTGSGYTPSSGDLKLVQKIDPGANKTFILVHPEGMTKFQRSKDFKDAARLIDCFKKYVRKKKWNDANTKEFSMLHGMLPDITAWSDERGVERFLRYINDRKV